MGEGATQPTAAQQLDRELTKIEARLAAVARAGRDQFFDGSEAYDRATVAAVRLAALYEPTSSLHRLVQVASEETERGLIATRNIAAHSGYAAMDDDRFWETAAVFMPELVRSIREANGI